MRQTSDGSILLDVDNRRSLTLRRRTHIFPATTGEMATACRVCLSVRCCACGMDTTARCARNWARGRRSALGAKRERRRHPSYIPFQRQLVRLVKPRLIKCYAFHSVSKICHKPICGSAAASVPLRPAATSMPFRPTAASVPFRPAAASVPFRPAAASMPFRPRIGVLQSQEKPARGRHPWSVAVAPAQARP